METIKGGTNMPEYVLRMKELGHNGERIYFIDPSYAGWYLTSDIEKATVFEDLEEAEKVCEAVSNAVGSTYWDWSDIPPWPEVHLKETSQTLQSQEE